LAAPAKGALSSVAFSYDGKFVAAGSQNGYVYAWDLSTQRLTDSEHDRSSYGVTSVAFNQANSLLAAGDANGNVYLWAHKLIGTLHDHASGAYTARPSVPTISWRLET